MRYSVCVFPSLLGTPWKTRFWILSRVYAMFRQWCNLSSEVRIIDLKTGEHEVW